MSSKNAITYGIFSTSPLLPGESKEEFEALKEGIAKIYPPVDVIAASMVERIALCVLRQQRLRKAEVAKLEISMHPEVLAQEIARTLGGTHTITAKHISDEQEIYYQLSLKLINEFSNLNINLAHSHLEELALKAPNIFAQLKTKANDSTLSFDAFMKSEPHITNALKEIKNTVEDFAKKGAVYHRAHGMVEQFKLAKLILDSKDLTLLSKYQVQLDTDLYRAIDAYKKHVAWRSEVLEVEVEDESSNDAIAA